ncbi:MAG: hypothetical protein GY906_10860 [bacterium]|nr:hypothetical protein [bacterium]
MVDWYKLSQTIGHTAEETLKWGASGAGGFAGAVVGGGTTLGLATAGGAGLGAAAGWGAASGTIYGIHGAMKALAELVEGPPATRSIPTPGPYRGPSTIRPPVVESGIQYEDGVIYWPKSRHWDFSARPDPVTLSNPNQRAGGGHPPRGDVYHRMRSATSPSLLQLDDAPSRTILGLSGEGADIGLRSGSLGLASSAGWWDSGSLTGPGPSVGATLPSLTLNVSPTLDVGVGVGVGQQLGGLANFNTSLNVPGIAANNLIPSFGFPGSTTPSTNTISPWGDDGGGFLRNLWNQGNKGAGISSPSLGTSAGGFSGFSSGTLGTTSLFSNLSSLGASLTPSATPSITLQTPSTLQSLSSTLSSFGSGQLGSSLSSGWNSGGYSTGYQSGRTASFSLSTSPSFSSQSFGTAGFGGGALGAGGFASSGFGAQSGLAGFATGLNAPGFSPGGFGGPSMAPGMAGGAFGGVGAGFGR